MAQQSPEIRMNRRRLLVASSLAMMPLPLWAGGLPETTLPNDTGADDTATISRVRIARPVLSLTFDDGPHPRLTPRLLDILREARAKATFYLIGNRVAEWPRIAARIAEEGHELGNHSWSHPNLTTLPEAEVWNQIDRTSRAIFQATGQMPVTFRPPFGAFSRDQRAELYKSRSMPSILWDVDPKDWKRPGESVISRRVLQGVRRGSIVLSHDVWQGTIDAMPAILGGLSSRGMAVVPVNRLIGLPRAKP